MTRPSSRLAPFAFASAAALAVVAALFAAAAAPAAAEDMMMGGAGDPPPVVPDPGYLRDKVLPLLDRHCGGCHDASLSDNRTRNKLVAPGADGRFDADAVRRNYDNLKQFLDPQRPERSALLQKLVSGGGIDHDGGKADDSDFPADLLDARGPLVAWVFGATLADAPPVALAAPVPRQVTVGEEVRLDASLSADPEGKPVAIRWEVYDAPQRGEAKPEDPRAKATRIVPDREGPWVVRLCVDDGKLRGMPALVRFAAVRKAAPPGPAPSAAAGGEGAPDASAVLAALDVEARRTTRMLYLDLWGRSPTSEELAALAPLPFEQRVDALLDSEQTWANWIEDECFYFLLIDQFRPVSDRVKALPGQLRDGRTSWRDALRTIALSAEFNARNPGNDTYCTVVLEQFLGIEVQKQPRVLEAAKQAYDGKLQRLFDTRVQNQSDVVQVTLAQKAATDLFVRRMAQRFLAQDLPKGEHEAVVSILHGSPQMFREVVREWLLSGRYAGAARRPHRKNDLQFIRSLFVDVLGRPPSYEEFRNMRNALQALADPAPLRGVLGKVLLDSSAALAPPVPDGPERYPGDRWRPQVTDLFRRFLGRDPSQREMDVFVETLQEKGATWRTAAQGLLAAPEYGYY